MIQGNWSGEMHHDGPGWHWIPMLVIVVALAVLLVWCVRIALQRGAGATASVGTAPPPHQHPGPHRSAEDILAERLAHGDIEIDDYHRRLEALHKTRP
jgi:putative membrane protein